MKRRAVTLLLLVLAGCRAGPNYHAPAPLHGAEAPLFSVNEAVETRAASPDAWWELYGDSRLNALVEEAFIANRDLRAAEANLAASRAVLTAVRANRYPSTEIAAGAIRGRDPTTEEILELQGQRPQNIWLFEDLFQVAYEVDLFGRIHREIEAAHANADAAAAARDSVKVVIAAETVRAYAAICALGEQVKVAHHSLDIVAREAQITDHRYQAGGGTNYDVKRAQALVAQVRADIPTLEGERRAAVFTLAALLGRTPREASFELETCVEPPHLGALVPVGDGSELLRRRPDVRQAERRLAAATAQIGVASADLYPTVKLVGFYGGAATQVSDLGTNAGLVWGLGPTINWNFFNQSAARARVREAKASEVAALASFDSVVLGALKETEQALTVYGAALQNHAALLEARDEIHGAFEIAQHEAADGALSSLDLLTTEQSLVTLDASVAAADGALVLDQISIFKALGGGWKAQTPP
ncbi:MAG TPA: efflux transporter outer membrane subunit [Steroidobacteraceae bacterium]|jgi:NodT family efflux transporter outer membrane factor (OMF) lipoprotein|nr:efflux transporter outer membrane subunit [Steroidobacteraceae bacterium]